MTGSAWYWALSADGQHVTRQGLSTPAELPPDAECLLVVPPGRLSWHRLTLPKLAPARLRAALEGLLEEHLLDDPALLHFALEPGFRPGQAASVWVAVCRRDWLRDMLLALEQAGHKASRILPSACPQASRQLWLQEDGGQAWCIATGPEGVFALSVADRTEPGALPQTLTQAVRSWLESGQPAGTDIVTSADASLLALAEQVWPAQPWTVATAPERWLQSLQQGWNLAQFDLSLASPRGGQWLSHAWRTLTRAPAWRPLRWSLVTLLGLQLLGLNLLAWQEKRHELAQQAELKALLTQTFPQVKLVLDAPRQMRSELERLRQQQGELGGGDLESLLATIGSSGQPVSWNGIEFGSGQTRLSGVQANADAQQALEAALSARGWRAGISGSDWQLEWEKR